MAKPILIIRVTGSEERWAQQYECLSGIIRSALQDYQVLIIKEDQGLNFQFEVINGDRAREIAVSSAIEGKDLLAALDRAKKDGYQSGESNAKA